ncbi:MAG: hypothetical protein V4489_08620 [Chlamydiota bacterium]
MIRSPTCRKTSLLDLTVEDIKIEGASSDNLKSRVGCVVDERLKLESGAKRKSPDSITSPLVLSCFSKRAEYLKNNKPLELTDQEFEEQEEELCKAFNVRVNERIVSHYTEPKNIEKAKNIEKYQPVPKNLEGYNVETDGGKYVVTSDRVISKPKAIGFDKKA